jgi:glycosyltransferase involved in cell wall biosynthesis
MDKHDMINRIKAVRGVVENNLGTKDLPNVYLLHGELSEKEMNALYNHPKVKAMINFTHGEGFGAPLLEFSMTGKPILVSNWSGHLDFLDGKLCKLLDGEVKELPPESVNEWLIKGSSWFTVNYSKASELMKTVFYNYGAYLDRAEILRIRNIELFSTKAMDMKFWSMLDEHLPKFAIETKLTLPRLKKIELPKLKKIGTGEEVQPPT